MTSTSDPVLSSTVKKTCPNCGVGLLDEIKETVTVEKNGKKASVPACFSICEECGYVGADKHQKRKNEEEVAKVFGEDLVDAEPEPSLCDDSCQDCAAQRKLVDAVVEQFGRRFVVVPSYRLAGGKDKNVDVALVGRRIGIKLGGQNESRERFSLASAGWRVFTFCASEVENNMSVVLSQIEENCSRCSL